MNEVIVVFPHAGVPDAFPEPQRRWLARGAVHAVQDTAEPLDHVLKALGLPEVGTGHAALRFLGETGVAPSDWIAAADPILLMPRLRDVVAQKIPGALVPDGDLEEIIETAQSELGDPGTTQFRKPGRSAYLISSEPMPTSSISPGPLHGLRPDAFLPEGPGAYSFHRLNSELQMLLHDHPVNRRRVAAGLPTISGLWIWGGGTPPTKVPRALPMLFGDDPLFSGYWQNAGGYRTSWPGSLSQCLESSADTAVVNIPESGDGGLDAAAIAVFDEIITLMKNGRLRQATMFFGNELRAQQSRYDRLKVWRKVPDVLKREIADE